MSLALTTQPPMTQQPGATPVGVPQFNALDIDVVSQSSPILKNGGGVITFRDGATQLTIYGFSQGTLPEIGAVVKIWGVSQERGPFLLPTARCISHGTGILENSATFVQLIAPPPQQVGIPSFNAEASVASEYGLLYLKNGGAVLTSRPGATQITVFGFAKDRLPQVGAVVKIWGVSHEQGPYFLPNARCSSHGTGILEGSATFVQIIAPPQEEVGEPRMNAFDVYVTRDGQPLMEDGSGVITFLFGGTEITAYGFADGKLPEIGDVVTIWGVSLERGHFYLPNAKCTSHGGGLLKNSATFSQMIAGPTNK